MGLGLAEKTRHRSGVTEGHKGRYGGRKAHLPELRKVRERQCPCWAFAFASFATATATTLQRWASISRLCRWQGAEWNFPLIIKYTYSFYFTAGYQETQVNFLLKFFQIRPWQFPGWEKKCSSTPSSCQEASETIYPSFVIVQVQKEPEHCKHLSVRKELMKYGVCAITLEWV